VGNLAKELEGLLNSFSRENESNTPDFILAEYMLTCLAAFEKASVRREAWFGKYLSIEGTSPELAEGVSMPEGPADEQDCSR